MTRLAATLTAVTLTAGVVGVGAGTAAGAASLEVSSVQYGRHAEEVMTVFTPAGHRRHPAVLFVHGGAWTRAWPLSDELDFAKRLAAQTGWVVGVPAYDTSTRPGAWVQPHDIELALSRLRRNAHVDPARVALWGESAGGNLSLIVAYAHPDAVRAVVSVSGPTDMPFEYRRVDGTLRHEIRTFEQGTPGTAPRAYRRTSPIHHVRADSPPTFLATSSGDHVVPPRQERRLYADLHRLGVLSRLVVVSGSGHSSEIEAQRVPGSTRTVRGAAIAFLARRLHPNG